MFLINFAAHADIKEKRHDAVYFIFKKIKGTHSQAWCEQDETKKKNHSLETIFLKSGEVQFVGFGGI